MLRARDFFATLAQDHDEVRDLFASLMIEEDATQLAHLQGTLRRTLMLHLRVEEAVLYPTLLEVVKRREDRVILHGGLEEHRLMNDLLQGIANTDLTKEQLHGRLHALEKLWRHHVEEEEAAFYDMARRAMPIRDFAALSDRLDMSRSELGSVLAAAAKDPFAE